MLELANLLQLTLAHQVPQRPAATTAAGTRLQWWADGVLAIEPAAEPVGSLLLSAGVHGNETAPIELLDRLLKAIASDELIPRQQLLLVLGNPVAIRAGERYLDYDLNRLFNGRHASHAGLHAAERAEQLEVLVGRFFSQRPDGEAAPGKRLHYDLHTAIRDSAIEQFALYPDNGQPLSDAASQRLAAANISAVVLQQGPAGTFSAFTANEFGCESMTLELGQARPFGHNAGVDVSALEAVLRALITASPLPAPKTSPQRYIASREVIKLSDSFVLHLADDVANFTPLPQGMTLADDAEGPFVISEANARILFPNPNVKVGLRAGIVVVPAA